MVNVLVTGHQGYIGSTLVDELQKRGHTVVGFDTGFFADCLASDATDADRSFKGDTRSPLDEAFVGVDAVIHLAALSNDPMGALDPTLTEDINVRGTQLVAEAAKRAGASHFLFASSCSVYGAGDGDTILDESSPVAPITEYAKSKAASEAILRELSDENFKITALRAATVFGYSARPRLDLVINELAANSVVDGEVRLKSLGTSWRPFVHVNDLVNAYIEILETGGADAPFSAFNVGSEETTFRIIDVANAIAEQTGAKLVIEEGAQADLRNYRVSFDLFRETFPGWSVEWNLERGVDDLVANFKASGLDRETQEGDKYRRLPHLEKLRAANVIDERFKLV